MSLFEEPHLEPQPEPEKPKKKKLLSIGIGAALIVAVLVTSVVAFSFGQSGKPADNVPDPPQREEVQTPSDTDIPSDESTDTEKPEDTTPSDSAQETPSTSGKQEIDPSTGKDKIPNRPGTGWKARTCGAGRCRSRYIDEIYLHDLHYLQNDP